jgi:non-ribosomal peptide synthetase component F
VVIGTPIAGRTDRALDEVVGVFVNTLVLRMHTAGVLTWRELVGRARQTALAAYGQADIPFERVVEAVNPARSLARHPLVQVFLTVESAALAPPRWPTLDVQPYNRPPAVTEFDLSVHLSEQRTATGAGAGLAGGVAYRRDLFTPATGAALAARLQRVLEAMARDADARLATMDLLSVAERAQIVDTWNATAQATPAVSAPDLIAQQIARTPDAVAVVQGEQHLTYAALNRQAQAVAAALHAQGIGPETIVGVAVGRSLALPGVLLGLWHAGAVYLPLDLSYPAERLRFIVHDAAPAIVITDDCEQRHPACCRRTVTVVRSRRVFASGRTDADECDIFGSSGREPCDRGGRSPPARSAARGVRDVHLRLNGAAERRSDHSSVACDVSRGNGARDSVRCG